MNRAWTFGRWIVTTCTQAQGAPRIDGCFVREPVGRCRSFRGWALRVNLWRRRSVAPGLALVLAREVRR